MIPIDQTERCFKSYRWDGKHYLFGYEADTHPTFAWIRSLEERFKFIRDNPDLLQDDAPVFLIREMIKWGASKKRDISPKFDDYIGTYCLADKLRKVIKSLDSVEKAIGAALDIPGLGPTYASKLLRFLKPSMYGALDGQIKDVLLDEIKERVIQNNGKKSDNKDQYVAFISMLTEHQEKLLAEKQLNLSIAEIEMALFQWAAEQKELKKEAARQEKGRE